jgi:hypothetical protein
VNLHWPTRPLPVALNLIQILSSHRSISLPNGSFPSKFPPKILWAFFKIQYNIKTRTGHYFSHSQVATVFNWQRNGLNESYSKTWAHMEQQVGFYLLNHRKKARWKLNVKYHKRICRGHLVINTVRRVLMAKARRYISWTCQDIRQAVGVATSPVSKLVSLP